MKFRARKTFRFGPLRMTVNQAGRRSWSIRVWRYTYNITRNTSSFDTPRTRRVPPPVTDERTGLGRGLHRALSVIGLSARA